LTNEDLWNRFALSIQFKSIAISGKQKKQILCVLSVCAENKYQISPLLVGRQSTLSMGGI
jgi:hypothetical protein